MADSYPDRCRHGLLKATCAYCSPRATSSLPNDSSRTVRPGRQVTSKPAQVSSAATLSSELLKEYVPLAAAKLARIAREHRLVAYSELMNEFGGRGFIGQVLDEINRREHARGRPLLSAIVVQKDTGEPGPGFWHLVSELFPTAAKAGFWQAERDRVWAYEWTED